MAGYVLGELLGRGGMAEVFAGHAVGSHGFQKPVAIKRLLPELANDQVFVERLIQEAKLLISLQHGNIVSVLDLARDGDDVFLVMEFVDGPSLRQLLKARGSRGLSVGVATYVVQAAAAGLEFAHARPGGAIIHADISPSNLLLTTSGEVRVADFGIARREGGGAGVVEGKWAYMAPEQARGEPLTPRSDVFALGVVLYELITGEHPFGKQVSETDRRPGVRVVPPRVLRPSIPHGLDAICMRALAFEPHDRYARMQQLFDALTEERFGNGWRDGANELAQAIREITPGGIATGPKTQHTDRPVTIVTRSLISEPLDSATRTAPVEPSVNQAVQMPVMKPRPIPPVMPMPIPAIMPMPIAALMPRLSHGVLPVVELASVHGGNTITGTGGIAVTGHTYKWTIAVFGIAAVFGAIAAIAMSFSPGDEDHATGDNSLDTDTATTVAAATPPAPPEPPPPPPSPDEVPVATPVDKVVTVATEPDKPDPAPEKRSHGSSSVPVKPIKPRPPVRPPISHPSNEDGVLRVTTENGDWANIYVDSPGIHRRGETPAYKFKLPAGNYKVRLSNPDNAAHADCGTVTVDAERVTTLYVSLDDGQCDRGR